MPITILIADDQLKAHQHAAHSLPLSKCVGWQLKSTHLTKTQEGFTTWLKDIDGLFGEIALVLDLGFRGANDTLWSAVDELLKTLPSDSPLSDVPQDQLDGLAAALAVIRLPNVTRLLIFVASGRHNKKEQKVIEAILSQEIAKSGKSSTHKITFAEHLLADSASDAQNALNQLAERWVKLFPDLHSDFFTNKILSTFLSPWIEGVGCPENKFSWCHECLDSASTVFSKKLRSHVLSLQDTQSAKCLLMLEADVATPSPQWRAVWTRLAAGADERRIQSTALKELLSALKIADFGIEGKAWTMPIVPALPFLISLSHLIRKFQEDNGPTPTVVWKCEASRYQIHFTLSKTRLKGGAEQRLEARGLEQAYNTMLTSGRCHGVCEALHNTLFCRLGGLNEIMPMLGLFNGKGLDKPVIDLEFGDYSFQLSWPRLK